MLMIFEQTFQWQDLASVGVLAFIETLLSLDNAVVLGLLAAHLEERRRHQALYIGMISAFFFRAIGILLAVILLKYPVVQLLGAIYLMYICSMYFIKKKKKKRLAHLKTKLWTTVLLIELFDLAFAVDSIIAGVAFIGAKSSTATFHPKIWIVYLGGMFGVIGIRYTAHLFSSLLERFPRLAISAHLMVGWIGIKLIFTSFDIDNYIFITIFWLINAGLLIFGMTRKNLSIKL